MEWGLPPDLIVHKETFSSVLAESASEFLTQRGDYNLLQETCAFGEGVMIGVADTGVDKTHLEGDLEGVEAKDFTGSSSGYYDRHSHGSHTTGHILGRMNDDGMRGLCPKAAGRHAKVLGDSGNGSTDGITKGMLWLADEGCEIINLSLGGSFSSDIEGACRELAQQGVMVNASMGNSGLRGDGHPGNSRYTFGITAVDFSKRIATFSSRSEMAKYCGYGVQVLSCVTGGRWGRMSGTSMSCPDFCGLCGLILAYMKQNLIPKPSTMEQWEAILAPGVEDLGVTGWDREYGIGFINIWKVLENLKPVTRERFTGNIFTETGKAFIVGDIGEGTFELQVGDTVLKGRAREER